MFKFLINRMLTILFLFITIHTKAQVNDAGAWLSLTFEKKISRAFSINLAPEVRFNENCREAGTFISDFGLEYKINKSIKTDISYRLLLKRQLNDSYSLAHRVFGDITATRKLRNWQTRFRLRLQYNDIDWLINDGNEAGFFARIRIELQRKICSSTRLFINGEPYFQLSRNNGRPCLDKLRFMAGFEYEINHQTTLKFFFLHQSECYHNNPQRDFVLGVNYQHSF